MKMFQKIKMNQAKKLLKKRIILLLEEGKSKEEIFKKAEKIGWKKEIIEEIFKQIEEKKKLMSKGGVNFKGVF